MGIELNRQTWQLLDEKDRTRQEDIRMINLAMASLYHWRKSDEHKIVNEQRGQWLLSHVHAMLKISDKALLHAKKTLKITEDHDLKDFDLAYAYEAMARACSISGNAMESKNGLKKQNKQEI